MQEPDHSLASASNSEDEDVLNLADDEGWEDLEPDVEIVKLRCLMCPMILGGNSSITEFLEHSRNIHEFDLVKIQKTLSLDYINLVKLINYVRGEILVGNEPPDISKSAAFQEDRYLQPVLEDDALLYNLHDIIGEGFDTEADGSVGETYEAQSSPDDLVGKDVPELEKELRHSQQEANRYKQELEALRVQFGAIGDSSPEHSSNGHQNGAASASDRSNQNATAFGNTDSSYFASYSGHQIHETMLKDKVRTEAYRDFIYENKHLFQGKTVLDVGCGTGILSMFCARAGAASVIAVDNSDIINFARENIYKNGMAEKITCLRGKIEEVILPVKEVDIIVSEWMGYCLLYEAMLDSVLWARDRYLRKDGLMIPSHCTLRLAPLTDAEYVEDHIHHWKDVYGFDMISMHKDIHDDVIIKEVADVNIPSDSAPFRRLKLKDVSTKELTFEDQHFAFELTNDVDALDGFVIWFDTFFMTTSDAEVPAKIKAEECKRDGGEAIAFTTGPHGKGTHWQQGILLIDYKHKEPKALKKGQSIEGSIGYKKRQEDNRALDIDLRWHIDGSAESRTQTWSMR